MGTDDIGRVYDKLDDIAQRMVRVETLQAGTKEDLVGIKQDIASIKRDGCSKATSHQDHEQRLRVVEAGRAGFAQGERSGISFRGFKAYGPAALEFAKPLGVGLAVAVVIAAMIYAKAKGAI